MKDNFYISLLMGILIGIIACLVSSYFIQKYFIPPTINIVVDTKMMKDTNDKVTSNYKWIELVKKEGLTLECE